MFSTKYTLTAFAAALLAATAVSQAPTVFNGNIPDAGAKFDPVKTELSYALCFGDGSGAPCPVNNNGLAGHGCDNSEFTGGGQLFATGLADYSNDTLRLNVIDLPKKTTALYMQGTLGPGKGGGRAFGDGLWCLGGTVLKLGTSPVVYGSDVFPDRFGYNTGLLSDLGGIPRGGGTRYYQAMYRDHDPVGTAVTCNFTNAWMQVWVP